MKIGIDVDDVLVDFTGPFLKFYGQKTDRVIPYHQATTFYLEDLFKCTIASAIETVREFYRSSDFDNLSLMPDAREVMYTLSRSHALAIVTSRHNEGKEKTSPWINRNFPGLNLPIFYSGGFENRKKVSKAEICCRNGMDYIIEDNVDYANECARAGVKALLFTRPWNTKEITRLGVTRVDSWESILNELSK